MPDWGVIFLSEVDAYRANFYPNGLSGHSSFRHWPGEGSLAMMFVVRQQFKHAVRSQIWKGRCGALHIFQRDPVAGNHVNLFIVGVHAPHDEESQIDTLADVASLLKKRPWGSKICAIGDWNVDQLPSLAIDPFSESPERSWHHFDERERLNSFADRFRLCLHIPDMVCSIPGGPFADVCWRTPITRIPVGLAAQYTSPSLLDYALCSPDTIDFCRVHWDGAPADHAIIDYSVNHRVAFRRVPKTTWKCTDEDACLQWVRQNAPVEFVDLASLHDFVFRLQRVWGDDRTCKQKRADRLPQEIRDLYRQLASVASEAERSVLQKRAWNLRKQWCDQWKARHLAETLKKGGVIQRSKKLHPLQAVVLSDVHADRSGHVSQDRTEWAAEISHQFSKKWGSRHLQRRVNILDATLPFEAVECDITGVELTNAFARIKHKARLDHYGVSVAAIQMLLLALPRVTTTFFNLAAASTPIMSSIVVKGHAYGKESATSLATNIRAILPLPSVMQILDVVLPSSLEPYVNMLLPPVPDCFIGARPKTQCLDIAHGLQSVLEKGLDKFGDAAVAQCDIEKFYDSLPVLLIMRWLVSRGVPASRVACVVRHQMCPRVVLQFGGSEEVTVSNRTIGGLTGSRTAGFLGRIPVEAIIAERREFWTRFGFHAGNDVFSVCTWVDNIFSASDSLHGAISILEDFQVQLETKWNLRIKDSSRCCMAAMGNRETAHDLAKWPAVDVFPVLGHKLQSDGSVRACWTAARSSMWRSFWSNAGSRDAKHLNAAQKIALVRRAVAPQIHFRCSRWPPQKQIATEVNKVQQKMTACVLKVVRDPGEELAEFVRRRGRLARKACHQAGSWSNLWFNRALKWDEHLDRERNHYSWAARLRSFRGKQFLQDRRALFNSTGSIMAGRTETRAFRGKVNMRWHDGIDYAKDVVQRV